MDPTRIILLLGIIDRLLMLLEQFVQQDMPTLEEQREATEKVDAAMARVRELLDDAGEASAPEGAWQQNDASGKSDAASSVRTP